MLKVIHLSTTDTVGGAARAAFRMHESLRGKIDTKMLVYLKYSNEPSVIGLYKNNWFNRRRFLFRRLLDKAPLFFHIGFKKGLAFSPGWLRGPRKIFKIIAQENPDIIHLHWFNRGFLSIKDLLRLEKLNKPIFWTFHDMWPLTGGYHYEQDRVECLAKITAKIFQKKLDVYSQLPLHILAPSHWLEKKARASSLFSQATVQQFAYSINTDFYQPIDRIKAKRHLGIDIEQKVVLYGATQALTDSRKGFKYLQKALEYLVEDNILLLIFGADDLPGQKLPVATKFLGNIKNEAELPMIYSASDVFVGPSLEDNLPNTFLEAAACGVPSIGFAVGGIQDIIVSGESGYLAKYKNSQSLAQSIRTVLQHATPDYLRQRSRELAVDRYSYPLQAERLIQLYKKVIKN